MKRIMISLLSLIIFTIETIIVKNNQSRVDEKKTVKEQKKKVVRTRDVICKNAPRFKSRQSRLIISTEM